MKTYWKMLAEQNGMKHGEKEWWKQQWRLNIACLTALRYNTNHHQTHIQTHATMPTNTQSRTQYISLSPFFFVSLARLLHHTRSAIQKKNPMARRKSNSFRKRTENVSIQNKINTQSTRCALDKESSTRHNTIFFWIFQPPETQRFSIDNWMATEALATVLNEAKPQWQQ